MAARQQSPPYICGVSQSNCSKNPFQRELLYSTAANIPQFMTAKPILPQLRKYNFRKRILHTGSKLLNTVQNYTTQNHLQVKVPALFQSPFSEI